VRNERHQRTEPYFLDDVSLAAKGLQCPQQAALGAAYCVAGRRGGVFAHPGTMSSTLLLPEQAPSNGPKINNATMRIMTGGFPEVPLYRCSSTSGLSHEIKQC
jgi:hypothetical protein